jgi:hypothetical protein
VESNPNRTPAREIPGHHKPKSDKFVAKSPKSPKSGKSPGSEIISMADESLQELKTQLMAEKLS